MKPVPASFVAMVVGYACALSTYVVCGVVRRGYVTDLAFMTMWPAIFAFIAWAVFVVPVVMRFGDCPFLSDRRWAWIGWAALAFGAYLVLVVWWVRWPAILLLWHPAIMVAVAGLIYSLIRSRADADIGEVAPRLKSEI